MSDIMTPDEFEEGVLKLFDNSLEARKNVVELKEFYSRGSEYLRLQVSDELRKDLVEKEVLK